MYFNYSQQTVGTAMKRENVLSASKLMRLWDAENHVNESKWKEHEQVSVCVL